MVLFDHIHIGVSVMLGYFKRKIQLSIGKSRVTGRKSINKQEAGSPALVWVGSHRLVIHVSRLVYVM